MSLLKIISRLNVFWEVKPMSQEKVDAYKKEKKGRKARLAKQKRNQKIAKISCLVLLIAICSFAGWRVYAAKHPVEAAVAETSEETVPTEETVGESAEEEPSEDAVESETESGADTASDENN